VGFLFAATIGNKQLAKSSAKRRLSSDYLLIIAFFDSRWDFERGLG
jgi:hypothetical protein